MSTPFIGQLMPVSWAFAAKGFATCNGQILSINQNQALFSLLGTTYGGNGITTFALPNLQGRTPIGMGNGFSQGNAGGEAAHTLTTLEIPSHTHTVYAAQSGADSTSPGGGLLSGGNSAAFVPPSSLAALAASTVTPFGGGQPHENRQPFLVINWLIALQGIFPSPN